MARSEASPNPVGNQYSLASAGQSSHVCHCGRQFRRKEHLRRHQATHQTPTFICHVCQRPFSRNDLLRKHVARHVDPVLKAPRGLKACDACHANKTRCSGTQLCSLCSKRGIACTYKGVAADIILGGEGDDDASTSALPSPARQPIGVSVDSGNSSASKDEIGKKCMQMVLESIESSESPHALANKLESAPPEILQWAATCYTTYVGKFHHHWPIIHPVTFDIEKETNLITASVLAIGCWLQGHNTDCDTLVATSRIHQHLVSCFLKDLTNPSHILNPADAWDVEPYQAALLNIILAFYIGEMQMLNRASMLLAVLVTTFRQIGLFSSAATSYQEKVHFPGTFIPYIVMQRDKWRRLVTNSMKIDTYLAVITGSCPLIHPEELDVTLPATFSLGNAHPLPIFYQRRPHEPPGRGISIIDLVRSPELLPPPFMLLEDVELGLCGLYMHIWRGVQKGWRRKLPPHGEYNADDIGRHANWKAHLDRIYDLCSAQGNPSQTPVTDLPLRAYYGGEDIDNPNDRESVLSRVKSLAREIDMLYNLIGIQLYSQGQIIRRIPGMEASDDASLAAIWTTFQGVEYAQAVDCAQSWGGRKAIEHSITILKAQERAPKDSRRFSWLGPLATHAIPAAAKVVRLWLETAGGPCSCAENLLGAVGLYNSNNIKDWVDNGGRLLIDGLPMCVCSKDTWDIRFEASRPQRYGT